MKPSSHLHHLFLTCVLTSAACLAAAAGSPRIASLPQGATVPDAEVDSDGVIHVAYMKEDNVLYVRSRDEGRTFSEPVRVNTEEGFASGGRFRGPDLAVGSDGRIHVVWYNAGYQQKRPHEEWGVMYARLEKGAHAFEKSRNLNRKPSDNFSLAADGKGNVAVIWMAGGVFANLSSDGGKTFSPPQDLKVDPCECCGSRAIYAADGTLSVLYRDKTDDLRDTNIASLSPGSTNWSNREISTAPWPINACPMTGSFLHQSASGLAAAWETRNQVYFALLDGAKGKPVETRAAENGRYPVILTSASGEKLVAWKNDSRLEWQFFDADNHPAGTPDSSPDHGPDRPAGVVTKTGTFVLFP